MTIVQHPSPNFSRGRANGMIPDMVVCHITGGSFPGSINWITNPQSQVSYHFTISGAGAIAQHVQVRDTAWANGTRTTPGDPRNHRYSALETVRSRSTNANAYTVSIGFEGQPIQNGNHLTQAQLSSAIWLVGHIRDEIRRIYGITMPVNAKTIVGHAHIVPRWKPSCPGRDFPFDEIIAAVNGDNGNSGANMNFVRQNIRLNGVRYNFDSINHNGTLYVPIRDIFTAIGATVKWDSANREAVVNMPQV